MWHAWGTGDVHAEFWWGNLRERHHLEDLGVNGKIMVYRIVKKWDGGLDRIDLAQNSDRWGML
jgi:hypothetical protein